MGFEEVTKENLVKWAASENLLRNSRDERRRKKETKKGGGPLDVEAAQNNSLTLILPSILTPMLSRLGPPAPLRPPPPPFAPAAAPTLFAPAAAPPRSVGGARVAG